MSNSPNFAARVKPLALRLEQTRQDVEQVVRDTPAAAWDKLSPYPGWRHKDQLAHLADGHSGLQSVLRVILEGRDPETSRGSTASGSTWTMQALTSDP